MLSFLQNWLLFAVVFIPLERILPQDRQQGMVREGLIGDLIYVFLNAIIIGFVLGGLGAGLIALREFIMPAAMLEAVAALPFWAQLAIIFLLGDLGFYLAHRAFHEIPLLWRFHAIHHSIETLDWIAAFRVHAFDQICTKGASLIPVVLLGFRAEAVALWALIYGWHSILLHSNVRLSFGPLEGWIASPHFHRWHHARDAEGHDKNYAGQLAFIDRLFDTNHQPKGRYPKAYGTDTPVPNGWLAQFLAPLRPRQAR